MKAGFFCTENSFVLEKLIYVNKTWFNCGAASHHFSFNWKYENMKMRARANEFLIEKWMNFEMVANASLKHASVQYSKVICLHTIDLLFNLIVYGLGTGETYISMDIKVAHAEVCSPWVFRTGVQSWQAIIQGLCIILHKTLKYTIWISFVLPLVSIVLFKVTLLNIQPVL